MNKKPNTPPEKKSKSKEERLPIIPPEKNEKKTKSSLSVKTSEDKESSSSSEESTIRRIKLPPQFPPGEFKKNSY